MEGQRDQGRITTRLGGALAAASVDLLCLRRGLFFAWISFHFYLLSLMPTLTYVMGGILLCLYSRVLVS